MEGEPPKASAIGRWLGIAAVITAVIAIFVPLSGIAISFLAVILAIVAALCGEYDYAIGTSAVVGINSFLLSPIMWLILMPPGQIALAIFVVCLVGAPFVAMWVHGRFLDR